MSDYFNGVTCSWFISHIFQIVLLKHINHVHILFEETPAIPSKLRFLLLKGFPYFMGSKFLLSTPTTALTLNHYFYYDRWDPSNSVYFFYFIPRPFFFLASLFFTHTSPSAASHLSLSLRHLHSPLCWPKLIAYPTTNHMPQR